MAYFEKVWIFHIFYIYCCQIRFNIKRNTQFLLSYNNSFINVALVPVSFVSMPDLHQSEFSLYPFEYTSWSRFTSSNKPSNPYRALSFLFLVISKRASDLFPCLVFSVIPRDTCTCFSSNNIWILYEFSFVILTNICKFFFYFVICFGS